MEYHKIDTLFERDPKTFIVNPEKLKSPVLGTITEWDTTEKIDGTNIRVTLSETGEVRFDGRSDNAQLNAELVRHLQQAFPVDKLTSAMWVDGPAKAVIYGEGYGAGIQKGGAYGPRKSFRIFDVLVGDKWWLDREAVDDVARKLDIKTAPYLGRYALGSIVDLVRSGFNSIVAMEDSCQITPAEGIVARPIEPLFDRKGARVIIKLKTKDFAAGKR